MAIRGMQYIKGIITCCWAYPPQGEISTTMHTLARWILHYVHKWWILVFYALIIAALLRRARQRGPGSIHDDAYCCLTKALGERKAQTSCSRPGMLQWAMENIPTAAIPKPSFILATPMQEPLVHFLKYFTGKKSGVNLFIMGGSPWIYWNNKMTKRRC